MCWSGHLAGNAGVVVVDVVSAAAAIIVVSINTIRVLLGLAIVCSSTVSEVCVWLHGTWLLLHLSPLSLSPTAAPTAYTTASTTSLVLLHWHLYLHLHHGLLHGRTIHYLSNIGGALNNLQLRGSGVLLLYGVGCGQVGGVALGHRMSSCKLCD